MEPTVFIIGAGPGLSYGLARSWGACGRRLVLFSRSRQHVEALCEKLRAEGFAAEGFEADCSNPEGLRRALEAAMTACGVTEVVIYNTCAITPDDLETIDASRWPARFMGDVGGQLVTAQVLSRSEAFAANHGAIIATGGMAGVTGLPGYVSLSVDKAALRMLVKLLHERLQPSSIFASDRLGQWRRRPHADCKGLP